MRRLWIVLSIVLAASATPQAQRGAVRLRIADANSGIPLRARITAASTVPLPRISSDEHGEASVEVGSSGRTVIISRPGYLPEPIKLAPGDEVVPIRLVRGAAISGRVIDMLGAPVVNRPILIGRQPDSKQPPRIARTDDLGAYRVGTLPDGAYTVSVGATTPPAPGTNASSPPPPSPDALPHLVVVRQGDDVAGIDFVVPPRVTCPSPASAALGANLPSSRRAMEVLSSGSIAGRVTTVDGRPVACVEVAAMRGGSPVANGVTDTDGSYVLSRLRAGAYAIEFKRAGFATMQWGQSDSGPPGRLLTLRDRERTNRIDIRLAKGGALTGTVVDEFGEPVEDVMVRALQLRDQGDRAVALSAGTAQTDDRGRYRIFSLLPGRYIVGSMTTNDDEQIGTGYAPAYYPGTVEIASATAVDVREDAERQWIDFARVPTRVVTITGTAVNSRSEPVTDRVILVASQRSGAVIAETQGADVKGADGAFTIANVPPGDYVLQATSKRGADEPPEFGMQYVTVFENDPLPVRIQTRTGIGLQGRLIEEGVPLVDPRGFTLEAIPVDWDQTSLLAGVQRVAPDGAGLLSLAGVTGPRRFVLSSSHSDWYLKSVRIRGGDVTDDVMGFPLGGFNFIRDLEVVVSNTGATVAGDVVDGSTLAPGSSVVLFSTNPDHWFRGSRFVKTVRGNQNGEFRIEGVADGEYFVVATDPLDGAAGAAWQQRDFLQSLIVGARRVRLREQEARTVTLTVVHR